VKPRQPYVEWANTCDDHPTKATLDDPHREYTAYLLPDWYDDDDLAQLLRKHSRFIFENELAGWSTDESTWPKRRDYRHFASGSRSSTTASCWTWAMERSRSRTGDV